MSTKTKAWIGAFRLRTLPLAIAGIILGSFLAKAQESFSWNIAIWAVITAVFLQVLSNLANDYGDFSKGTDNDNRVGPERALQSGKITKKQMKNALILFSIFSLISGIYLLWLSFGTAKLMYALIFLIIGLLSIWAAIKYTVGKTAYGYQGLGDVFVFIFFGWVSVVGVYFLHVQSIDISVFLPASTLGLLSAGVLNLNNTRDIVNDKESGKITLAVKLGYTNARKYQMLLFVLAIVLSSIYTSLFGTGVWQQLYWISVIPLAIVVVKTYGATSPKELDPLLKIQALSTLIYAISFGIGQVI